MIMTIRCNQCYLHFADDYALSDVVDEETDELVDGCPNCKTDAYLTDLFLGEVDYKKTIPFIKLI